MATETNASGARQGAAYSTITHLILIPIFSITFGVAINLAVHAHTHRLLHWWLAVVAFGLLLLTAQQRMYSLRVQDRVIRLEERMRVAALAPGINVSQLSMQQLIALRFASDAELPTLAQRTIQENLTGPAIKQSILAWRSDPHRI